jgi:protease II
MANDSEEIDDGEIEMQVWCVSPDTEGKNNRIVFDDSDDMLEHAHNVLDALFDRLGSEDEEDCEILTIEQSKMTRGQWRAIINMKAENNEPA